MNKRRFDIVEIEGEEIYWVNWDTDIDDDVELLTFDNYIDAFHQYEHLQKLRKRNVELHIQLLPLPILKKEDE